MNRIIHVLCYINVASFYEKNPDKTWCKCKTLPFKKVVRTLDFNNL